MAEAADVKKDEAAEAAAAALAKKNDMNEHIETTNTPENQFNIILTYGPYMNRGVWHHKKDRITVYLTERLKSWGLNTQLKFDPTETTWEEHGNVVITSADDLQIGTKTETVEKWIEEEVEIKEEEAVDANAENAEAENNAEAVAEPNAAAENNAENAEANAENAEANAENAEADGGANAEAVAEPNAAAENNAENAEANVENAEANAENAEADGGANAEANAEPNAAAENNAENAEANAENAQAENNAEANAENAEANEADGGANENIAEEKKVKIVKKKIEEEVIIPMDDYVLECYLHNKDHSKMYSVAEKAAREIAEKFQARKRKQDEVHVKCKNGHDMVLTFKMPESYKGRYAYVSCDGCKLSHVERHDHLYHCEKCEFDYCFNCAAENREKKETEAAEKDDETEEAPSSHSS